ncbi:MAG: hypothetical protein J0L92_23500 [Deltaproteobacteria bacterium]|nr:hypothetical protein [Deltaproteobacteria bacterium]
MLEIAMIVFLTRKLFALTAERGSAAWWAGMGPLLWISGEVSGAVVAGMFGFEDLAAYPVAIAFAIGGAVLSWAIVREAPIQIVLPSDETEDVLVDRGARS